MALATFHSFRGEKSALILLKENPFSFETIPVYVPKEPCIGMEKGHSFEIPDGYKLIPMVDSDGIPRASEDGSILQTLSYRKN